MNKSVRMYAFETIQEILNEGAYSNLKMNEVLSSNKINSVDRSLYTELVYGTIKRKYALDYMLKPFVKTKTKIKGWVRQLLWMSLYQFMYLDKVPNHAIINEAVDIAKNRGSHHNGNIVNGILRTVMRSELPRFSDISDDKKRIAIQYSLPKWIVDHWATHYGIETTESIAQSFLEPVNMTVRANISRGSIDSIIQRLEDEGYDVKRDSILPFCLHISGLPIINSIAFKDGYVSIQDKSSMMVAHIMNLGRDDKVLDACSAPGGKACHMAEILSPEGYVDATDIYDHKIKLIQHNINKLKLNNIHAFKHDATVSYNTMYDKILVDAPCSGLGVFRHKPEIKYSQSHKSILALVELQLQILENIKHNVKPGGTIVYSTCTIEQMENENVIYTFLKQNKDFEFEPFQHPVTGERVKTLQILPQDFNSDGFFITKIKRKDS
ncbi:16S rRNA (cytosine(967)-C(5))-methyltransferase RsmB [Staphylococcus saccharolyticus]|uniref:16S rRNA (cytosine(967)-C(5))-methyltransferase RsmB n=1 Tax=Staphylococcus saccharolyticus TaxID=33028 RepID=UPI00102DBFAF|nr:16S rRNA (cytosine(967)-C(5))-methyltransferase RsmB [Staphylococcus saccharolyticus]MBL7573028.1 16S rRNA (cytosine(967)-C(5))-methyltransferase RsmB [Staphylococcus saccharolyticus]MBL7584038.1 16S rRNA (cytosine(967)-C(5))-methyltransferase RsmB [Staphylococcus saccharolyticus]MBL7638643.1 16S rRNA (cytosine(967)-C(5))-methyltransferase RsmB [Staphylococcus saccharolyticus]QRJ67860.1 16S rRNA (cytosine(967)-C(5))-methyltransferase RsmB [Staphylococcus saccharolyticus]TAA93558.1 16S rRNA 